MCRRCCSAASRAISPSARRPLVSSQAIRSSMANTYARMSTQSAREYDAVRSSDSRYASVLLQRSRPSAAYVASSVMCRVWRSSPFDTPGFATNVALDGDRVSVARVRSRDYGPDVLAPRARAAVPEITAELDLVVEDTGSGFCGAVVGLDRTAVTLEDRNGRRRVFPYSHPEFALDGKRVRLVRPKVASPIRSTRTASGSTAVNDSRAVVARASRIFVEGLHDCELVEAIWGDDLRAEGIVVEQLEGADNLVDIVRGFRPGPDARLGVLLDHLVPGSKESRIASQVAGPDVLVVGHPFVDIWQAVKPARVGLAAWPDVPRGLDWKSAVAAHLGEPDVPAAWRRIRRAARNWLDLEPDLLAPVEALIDFVTGAHSEP